jgi:CheY-like chemotaxis protein
MLVDDDPHVLPSLVRITQSYFQRIGCSEVLVIQASDPLSALDQVSVRHRDDPNAPWALITDYDMPYMSGSVLLSRLDELLGDKLRMRLVMSGIADLDRRREIEDKKAFFVAKPFDSQKICSLLSRLVSQRSY